MQQLKTVQDCLIWSEKCFNDANLYFGHGTDNAWDEAVSLILFVLNLPLDTDNSILSRKITDEQAQKIMQLVNDRCEKRVPLAYLTHQAWFMRLPFYVDECVLVPRSPFGEWIAKAFSPWVDNKKVHRIAEMGTGSGCMAIAAALVFEQATIDAVDIDHKALAVAKKNVEDYKLTQRVHLIHSDLFTQLPKLKYDIIMSNPPYVSKAEMQTLPDEYLSEPRHALYAEKNGLAFVEQILKQAAEYLTEEGILVVEVGNSMQALQNQYPRVPFIWLEQEFGGDGLFLLERKILLHYF